MHLMSFPDGTNLDLDTNRGAYEHVGMFLKNNGATGDVFSSLGKLCPDSSNEIFINKKILFQFLKSRGVLADYNNNHIAGCEIISELDRIGILKEFLSK